MFANSHARGCALEQEMLDLEHDFISRYRIDSPYLEDYSLYPPDPIGMANRSIASAFMSQRLGCLSLTLEMPNKELKHQDWTIEDCKQFGAHLLNPLIHILPKLSNHR